ncbi:Asp-tRNA(Asn)/Glu-tRNA(Gln) amidotransferase subunit GatB [Hippea maritima]|uniref:Aspartyl/glutamyl-tRNA(Asn/Gln) amidotransferase subunit B n=1 Tax=Hippea maritima (strain ATCC 700847 / DSM 10411 / MH2) TaxID=760142 RepID=F2LUG1_HIPMA|nr:Asp-tRNA(Asn)/Glu-tRNA(Gln) amidotransferase subunit GatB [Hippea maritima]AEA33487.1 Aspartyl/glutamyl-tRNA(Asn/Gln) amidotransferase subunit B [Hippea maritima DSM 10411]
MEFEAVIGLEVHIQLLTNTKIFCSCSTDFGAPPNTHICPVCMGMPGVLPVLNKKVLDYAIKLGLALNCKINKFSRFARKNYFYPDLPKGYQISQYELPILEGGHVEIFVNGEYKKIGLERIHMEEDAGKTIHRPDGSYVDFNRAGVPLLEIVSLPVMHSPQEAGEYLRSLRRIVRYLGICDGNMEEGSLRCDANVSIRPKGQTKLGTKTELKNMNSFRHVEKALEYEIQRQIEVVEDGGKIIQQTRLWDEKTGMTKPMRSKEEAYEYRYFPDPDLVPIFIDDEWIERIKDEVPELPRQKLERFVEEYGLKEEDARVLVEEKSLADYFEEAAKGYKKPQSIANWILSELLGYLNKENKNIEDTLIKPNHIRELVELIDSGLISGKIAKTVFGKMYETAKSPKQIVEEEGLVQITDRSQIEGIVDEVIKANPKAVEQYKSGKKNTIGFFVGQVMKKTKGKANPKLVNEILASKLEEL